jgi:hypothetical protein
MKVDFANITVLLGGSSVEPHILLSSGNVILPCCRQPTVTQASYNIDSLVLQILQQTE